MSKVWILERRRIGEEEWVPCLDTFPRAGANHFAPGLMTREAFSRFEFRAAVYVRAEQPPPNLNKPGPIEPPRPPRDRSVR